MLKNTYCCGSQLQSEPTAEADLSTEPELEEVRLVVLRYLILSMIYVFS